MPIGWRPVGDRPKFVLRKAEVYSAAQPKRAERACICYLPFVNELLIKYNNMMLEFCISP